MGPQTRFARTAVHRSPHNRSPADSSVGVREWLLICLLAGANLRELIEERPNSGDLDLHSCRRRSGNAWGTCATGSARQVGTAADRGARRRGRLLERPRLHRKRSARLVQPQPFSVPWMFARQRDFVRDCQSAARPSAGTRGKQYPRATRGGSRGSAEPGCLARYGGACSARRTHGGFAPNDRARSVEHGERVRATVGLRLLGDLCRSSRPSPWGQGTEERIAAAMLSATSEASARTSCSQNRSGVQPEADRAESVSASRSQLRFRFASQKSPFRIGA